MSPCGLTFVFGLIFLTISCTYEKPRAIILPLDGINQWYAFVYDCECGKDEQMVDEILIQDFRNENILLLRYPRGSKALNVRFFRMLENNNSGVLFSRDQLKQIELKNVSWSLSNLSFNYPSICFPGIDRHANHEIVFLAIGKPIKSFEEFESDVIDSLILK